MQSELYDKIINWNFLVKTFDEQRFVELYQKSSISIEEYRKSLVNYDLVQFDRGLKFEKNKINSTQAGYQLIKKNKDKYTLETQNKFIESEYIKLPLGSQGLQIFDNKYKIIWSYMNYDKFYFTDKRVMIDYNYIIISSNEQQEMLYLFALLNSKVNNFIIDFYLKIPNEQAILLGLTPIKQFIKIPLMDKNKEKIKNLIVKQMRHLFSIEEQKLSDLVDFRNITIQKFDSYSVDSDKLILYKDSKTYNLKIQKTINYQYIKQSLDTYYNDLKNITLFELKNINIIDKEQQQNTKNYIDDLVYALYFNIELDSNDINNANIVHEKCSSHELYSICK